PWPRYQFRGFDATNPMRNGRLLQSHFRAQRPHFGGNVIYGLLRLGRAADARADIVGQMTQLIEGIWINERGIAKPLHCGDLSRRPGAFASVDHGVEAVEDRWLGAGGLGGRRILLRRVAWWV